MAYVLIHLDEEPNCAVSESEISKSGFIPAHFDYIVKDPGAADRVFQALELDGAKLEQGDYGIRITITPLLRERYFKHYYDEFKRWMERASKMDFKDFSTFRGEIKFDDAERWFKHGNDIYIWYGGWYCTLTEFLRESNDNEVYYFGTAFTLR